mmetsp:Transcript_6629/g.17184  ORF Transcript_6629/g.17184 Transcript_6629/m.17184 type:complete len:228 (+) Transcript_6629:3179-3862(+)
MSSRAAITRTNFSCATSGVPGWASALKWRIASLDTKDRRNPSCAGSPVFLSANRTPMSSTSACCRLMSSAATIAWQSAGAVKVCSNSSQRMTAAGTAAYIAAPLLLRSLSSTTFRSRASPSLSARSSARETLTRCCWPADIGRLEARLSSRSGNSGELRMRSGSTARTASGEYTRVESPWMSSSPLCDPNGSITSPLAPASDSCSSALKRVSNASFTPVTSSGAAVP